MKITTIKNKTEDIEFWADCTTELKLLLGDSVKKAKMLMDISYNFVKASDNEIDEMKQSVIQEVEKIEKNFEKSKLFSIDAKDVYIEFQTGQVVHLSNSEWASFSIPEQNPFE